MTTEPAMIGDRIKGIRNLTVGVWKADGDIPDRFLIVFDTVTKFYSIYRGCIFIFGEFNFGHPAYYSEIIGSWDEYIFTRVK